MPSALLRSRSIAFHKQGGLCFYCQAPMWQDDSAAFAARLNLPPRRVKYLQCTAEHLLARQNGGDDSPANVVAACSFCNRHRHWGRERRAPAPDKYRKRVRALMQAGHWYGAPVKQQWCG